MGWMSRSPEARRRAAQDGAPEPGRGAESRWTFEEGLEIAPGRHLLRPMGGGSRCEVHLAWDEHLFALVVAKILRPDRARSARVRAELAREADMLERLAHPSLVRGLGAVLDGPYPHLLLEHVEGPTLHRLVRRDGPIALEQLLPLGLQIFAVLHYLSGEGVVHLDVKPANVVMSVPPRVIDLSIARSVDDARNLRSAIGTDAYMAPEQCVPGSSVRAGTASDIWGAGATLYEAAVGQVPFPRASEAASSPDPAVRFPQLVLDAQAMPAHLPHAFANLVRRMLSRDPVDRPNAREAAEALEPLVAAVPDRLVPTRRGLVPPRARRDARE
jgi:eukaryotic-like serine/threonine-protein kinase